MREPGEHRESRRGGISQGQRRFQVIRPEEDIVNMAIWRSLCASVLATPIDFKREKKKKQIVMARGMCRGE